MRISDFNLPKTASHNVSVRRQLIIFCLFPSNPSYLYCLKNMSHFAYYFHISFSKISRPHWERDIFFKCPLHTIFYSFSIANNSFILCWYLVNFIFIVLFLKEFSIPLPSFEIFIRLYSIQYSIKPKIPENIFRMKTF